MKDKEEFTSKEGKALIIARLNEAEKNDWPLLMTILVPVENADDEKEFIAKHVYSGLDDLPYLLHGITCLMQDYSDHCQAEELIDSLSEEGDTDG